MLCDQCKKNEATVHIKEIHNGKCHSLNLCAECARQKEQAGELGALGINLAEVLFQVGKMNKEAGEKTFPVPPRMEKTVCPRCGWNAEKLRRSGGKMGCPECYRVFAPIVNGVIGHVQRGKRHCGKRPGVVPENDPMRYRQELAKLQRELKRFIQKEEYEEAALCRDRIKFVQQKLSRLGGTEL